MADKSHSSRITAYKNAVLQNKTNDLRRKRAELSVTLRKQARDEQLMKRRVMSPDENDAESEYPDLLLTSVEIVEGLKSSDLDIKTNAARSARRMLSRTENPPITDLINAGVLNPLVDCLDCYRCSDLQFEATWALTNIASGTHEQTMAIIQSGAVGKLVNLLGTGGVVAEQAIWALGNIAGDGPQPRDLVLKHGALFAILPALSLGAPESVLKTAVWTFSNFCRNKNPLVNFEKVAPALPHIADLLNYNDQDVLSDACWAISYLTDGPDERIEAVQMIPRLLPRLVMLLQHKSASVKCPALRAVGNMLTGSDKQTDRCIDAGCIELIDNLLRCGKSSLMKEAAWAISNILAGTRDQIQKVCDSGVLKSLVEVLDKADIKSQKEAAWAITNLCLGGAPAQLDTLVSSGFLEPYCRLLDSTDTKAVTVVLDGISNLLKAAEQCDQLESLCVKIEEVGALDKIEMLQRHENELIYKKSLDILDKYFADAGAEDLEVQPAENNGQFVFVDNKPSTNFQF